VTRCHALASLLAGAMLVGCAGAASSPATPQPVAVLPDISGMSWISEERLLVVHDAKRDRPARMRVGLLWLPTGSDGVRYLPLDIRWPATGASHDLESIARIPGTPRALFAESGNDGDADPRLYLVELRDTRLELIETVLWPTTIWNVEATTIIEVGEQLVFVYAERHQGADTTAIRWAPLWLDPIRFGTFEEFRFRTPDSRAINRGVVALETDPSGRLLAAGAFDPDVDDGPFRSRIYRFGRFLVADDGRIEYDGQQPERLFTVDGVKIEALAVRTMPDGTVEIVYGSDDEDFGGIVRRLRLP